MYCPYCKSIRSKVVDKRNNLENGTIRRRRECLDCCKRYTTYERVERIELDVIKKSGSREPFDREKLKRGIIRAVKKRKLPEEKIESLVQTIEQTLLNKETKEIESSEIGLLVLKSLKKIDDVGYILFASVYKDFKSIKDFEREINSLKKSKDGKQS